MNSVKIMIFGRPGSGKSTYADWLSSQLNIPVYHLDKYFYTKNWVERNYQDFLHIQQNFVNKTSWIIDGNATRSLKMRYQKADIVLYFNYPLWLCYWRAFKRLWLNRSHIDDRAEQCKETIRWSLLKYMWNFETRINKILPTLQAQYPNITFYEIKSDKELHRITNKIMNIPQD